VLVSGHGEGLLKTDLDLPRGTYSSLDQLPLEGMELGLPVPLPVLSTTVRASASTVSPASVCPTSP
jgi:hypothetical protein